MAKFCTKCGKKLEDGQVCDCENKEMKSGVEPKVATSAGNDMVNDYIKVLKGMFTAPVDTMKNFAKRSKFTLGLIMIAINCLVFGLFIYLFAKEGASSLMGEIYGYSLSSSSGYEIPFKVFVYAALFMAVFFLCLGGLLHLISGPILKKDSDIKKTFALIGATAVFTTVTTLVVIICMYIKIWLALILLAIAGIMYLLYLYHGFVELTKVDENKITYVFTGAYAITLFVVCYILPKILIS